MKGTVRLSLIFFLCLTSAKADAGSKDEQSKQIFNTANAIGPHQKPELLSYQQITHFGDKYHPDQVIYQQRYPLRTQHLQQTTSYQQQQDPIINKLNLVPQHQPTPVAMVIIAQPAYVPVSMLQQGNVAQQLLNYFHGNSLPRYQYIPIRNPQQPQQQYASAAPIQIQHVPAPPVQTQQVPQYVPYQQQEETTQPQISVPTAQAQITQFQQHEALPTPQALISQPHIVPQQNINEGRALQYNIPPQLIQYHNQQQQQQLEQQPPQRSEQQQFQPAEHQQHEQKPLQLTEISRIAQQAAQHFFMSGGLQSGSRTAPAIITGLEHFSPEQQEKIKKQLGVHFGAPLQPLNIDGVHEQPGQKNSMLPNTKYYHDHKQRLKTEKFVPSIEVKDGEITQSTTEGAKM